MYSAAASCQTLSPPTPYLTFGVSRSGVEPRRVDGARVEDDDQAAQVADQPAQPALPRRAGLETLLVRSADVALRGQYLAPEEVALVERAGQPLDRRAGRCCGREAAAAQVRILLRRLALQHRHRRERVAGDWSGRRRQARRQRRRRGRRGRGERQAEAAVHQCWIPTQIPKRIHSVGPASRGGSGTRGPPIAPAGRAGGPPPPRDRRRAPGALVLEAEARVPADLAVRVQTRSGRPPRSKIPAPVSP